MIRALPSNDKKKETQGWSVVVDKIWADNGLGGPLRSEEHYDGRKMLCFSNRPFEVKRSQTIRHSNVDVAHGLALLFGIGTRALPSWDTRTR